MDKATAALNRIISQDAIMRDVRGYGILEKDDVMEIQAALKIAEAVQKDIDAGCVMVPKAQSALDIPSLEYFVMFDKIYKAIDKVLEDDEIPMDCKCDIIYKAAIAARPKSNLDTIGDE